MFKTIEDFQAFSKGQFEAANQSATALSAGLQQIVAQATEFSKKSFDANSDVVQKLMGTKSVERALQVQMDYAKLAYESVVAESTKMTGIISAAAQDVFKPIEGVISQAQSAVLSTASA